MSRTACLLLILLLPAASGGCAVVAEAVVQGMLDAAFETREERHIRKDFNRHRQGEPLKHHRNLRDLQRHQFERDFHRHRFGDNC